MTVTYEKIATNTVSGTGTGQVTFSSISGSYTDLVLIASTKHSVTGQDFLVRVNSDSGTNYSTTRIVGDGSTAFSARRTNQNLWYLDEIGQPTTSYMVQIFNFMNYSNTTTFKTALWRNASAPSGTAAMVGLWRNTAAITTILIESIGGNMADGCTYTLYGIKCE